MRFLLGAMAAAIIAVTSSSGQTLSQFLRAHQDITKANAAGQTPDQIAAMIASKPDVYGKLTPDQIAALIQLVMEIIAMFGGGG